MFDPYPIEVKIFRRLGAIAEGLKQAGIPVVFLPKEATSYENATNTGAIQVIVAEEHSEQELSPLRIPTQDIDPSEDYVVQINQDITVYVDIIFSLPARYSNQDNEQGVLGGTAHQIFIRLFGFSPFENIAQMKVPLHFRQFELYQPEGGQWKAKLQMTCIGTIEVPRISEEDQIVQVALFATDSRFNTAIATKLMEKKLGNQ